MKPTDGGWGQAGRWLICPVLVLCGTLAAGTAAADGQADEPADEQPIEADLVFASALTQIHAGNAAAAEAELTAYLKRYPNDSQARQLLGLALAQQDRDEEAQDELRTGGAEDGSVDSLFQTASFRSRQPEDRLGPAYRSGLRERSRAAPPQRFNLTMINAFEYDSNVFAMPEFDGLGDIDDKDDTRWVTAVFGDYRLVQEPGWNLGIIGSTFDNWHFDNDEFDLQDYMGGAYTNHALGTWLVGLRYEYHYTLLDSDFLADDHRLVPNVTLLRDWGHTTAYYEYDTASSAAPFLIPAQIQSGDVNAVGVTQAFYTSGGEGRVYLGYRYEDADTDGDDFDRQTNMVTARWERPLAKGMIYDAEFRHFWDDYQNPNSLDFLERPRDDTRIEVRTGLQKNFNRHWSGRLDYTFTDTNSNVENLFGVNFFEFSRHIFSSQIIFNF